MPSKLKLNSDFRGEGSRNGLMTLYEVNLSSGLKIPKGNFSLKSQEAKGGTVRFL